MKAKSKCDQMKNAAVIYCRVSTQEQTENHSLSTQEKACMEYCQKRSVPVEKVLLKKEKVPNPSTDQNFRKCWNTVGSMRSV